MKRRKLLLTLTVWFSLGACAAEQCSCDPGGNLFVALSDAVPGGSVEVCFEGSCGAADLDGVADSAEMPFISLGDLEAKLGENSPSVTVTVFDAEGVEINTGQASLVRANNCCGDYWTATL